MTVRVRVMPSCYFILCRFYLRVDGVLVRVCETRVFGEKSKPYAIREWSKREALYAQLKPHVSSLRWWFGGNLLNRPSKQCTKR